MLNLCQLVLLAKKPGGRIHYFIYVTFTFSNQNLESYTASNNGSIYEILNYEFLPFRFLNDFIPQKKNDCTIFIKKTR